jgi:hypothetical protein
MRSIWNWFQNLTVFWRIVVGILATSTFLCLFCGCIFVGLAMIGSRVQSTASLSTSEPQPTQAFSLLPAPTNASVAPTVEAATALVEPTDQPTPTAPSTPTTPPVPTDTSIPTATMAPTDTPLPEPAPTSVPIIIDYSKVLNSSVKDVEKYLGKSSEPEPIKAGEYSEEFPGAGEAREYFLDNFDITIFYDKQGVAKVIFMFGLEQYGYKMDEWPSVMERLGFPVDSQPDRVAPAGRHWENYKGYGISLQAGRLGGPIDFAKMFVLP